MSLNDNIPPNPHPVKPPPNLPPPKQVSQPKRYDVGMKEETCRTTSMSSRWPWVYESDAGKYVLHSDYAALVQQGIRDHGDWRSKLNFLEADYKAEIARLTAENERLRSYNDEALAHIAKEERKSRERLEMEQAESERLRKALSDIEAAWVAKRAMDIIDIINKTKDTNAD